MSRLAIFVATSLLLGCPSKQPEAPRAVDDTALRVRVANAEARRGGGAAELVELATSSDVHARELALRGLGRIGGAQARTALETALVDPEPRVVAGALAGIGLAMSLDEDPQWNPSDKLVALIEKYPLPVIEALGRAGDASVQDKLAIAVTVADRNPQAAAAAALALGRHGRRKIAINAIARTALLQQIAHADDAVRYAVVYALQREHEPPTDVGVNAGLATRVVDGNAETRALAIAALAKRKAIGAARKEIEDSLRDRDWRVAVEAVRALAGANGDDAGRAAVSAALPRRLAELAKGNGGEAHIIIEALRLDGVVAPQLDAKGLPPIARGWIECLAKQTIENLTACPLPDHLRLPLLAPLAKKGDANARRAALRVLLGHEDPRVRAAGIDLLPATWNDGDAKAQATIVGTITSAMATKNQIVAGTAIDTATAIYEAMGANHPQQAALDSALLTRARTETDVELVASLYGVIGKRAIAGGADVCRAGLAGAPVRAKAAAECLRALGEAVPEPARGEAQLPPGEIASVIGKRLHWRLVTTRGEIVIELRPDVAPWAVAAIVALTQRGFYNGIEFHRVVPSFVVQGGDPTMSGWGGPGFTLPAEPGSGADSTGYVAGGVGIADAGRDSGGSQWFIMHSRAPHLDGRYTWIGGVISGQKSADALLIGDKVERATIEQK